MPNDPVRSTSRVGFFGKRPSRGDFNHPGRAAVPGPADGALKNAPLRWWRPRSCGVEAVVGAVLPDRATLSAMLVA